MEEEYILSYNIVRSIPYIVRRPWWKIFGRDRLIYKEGIGRICIGGITPEEAFIIRNNPDKSSPIGSLMHKLLGRECTGIRLERVND